MLTDKEVSSLLRLISTNLEKNIKLALSIFEGNPTSPIVFEQIRRNPSMILMCIEEGHQNILSQLRFIYLRRINLKEIPSGIKYLTNIIMLDFGYNQIQKLNSEIFKLISLKKLRLHHNQISRIDADIAALENLEELYLFDNPLQELPNSIHHLKKLRKLQLDTRSYSESQIQVLKANIPGLMIEIQ